jgi:glycosyltransferase involved in cell wall biosynthesis
VTGAESLRHVTLVLGTSAGGTGAHVLMLAAGLSRRGVAVSVAGPLSADARFSFSALPAVSFSAVEISARPRAGDLAEISRLRKLLLPAAYGGSGGGSHDGSRGGPRGDDHVVHAHGMRAGALTVLALLLAGGRRRPRVVVTVHNAPPPGRGAAALTYRLLERVVARGADRVLCVSPDLEARLRAAGARRVERAVIAAPVAASGPVVGDAVVGDAVVGDPVVGDPVVGVGGAGRPVVFAAGRLAAQKGFGVLLEAAASWRDLEPAPLVVIAGDGPLAGELRGRAVALGGAAVFLGQRDDVPARLAGAAVFVLPSYWEGQPLVLQEALRAGAPIVAARAGGVPGLTGEDAALLVPPGDTRALARAVRSVLTDQALAARLRAAARARAATLPTPEDALTAALAAYAAGRFSLVPRVRPLAAAELSALSLGNWDT